MNKQDLDVLNKVNKLEKERNQALRSISRLYDIAIWAGRRILKAQDKVDKLQKQIDELVTGSFNEETEVEIVETTSTDESKQSA